MTTELEQEARVVLAELKEVRESYLRRGYHSYAEQAGKAINVTERLLAFVIEHNNQNPTEIYE